MPKAKGIAGRPRDWLTSTTKCRESSFLQAIVPWGSEEIRLRIPTSSCHEDWRRFHHRRPLPGFEDQHGGATNEQVVHEYMLWAMCGTPRPKGTYKSMRSKAVPHAMGYTFKSLKSNGPQPRRHDRESACHLHPYLEMAHLEDYDSTSSKFMRSRSKKSISRTRRSRSYSNPRSRTFSLSTGQPFCRGALARDDKHRSGPCTKKTPVLSASRTTSRNIRAGASDSQG